MKSQVEYDYLNKWLHIFTILVARHGPVSTLQPMKCKQTSNTCVLSMSHPRLSLFPSQLLVRNTLHHVEPNSTLKWCNDKRKDNFLSVYCLKEKWTSFFFEPLLIWGCITNGRDTSSITRTPWRTLMFWLHSGRIYWHYLKSKGYTILKTWKQNKNSYEQINKEMKF